MRLALLWLKQITKPARVAVAKVFRDHSRLIVRVVIHDQNFPFDRFWESQSSGTIQRRLKALAAVIGTQNYSDSHGVRLGFLQWFVHGYRAGRSYGVR